MSEAACCSLTFDEPFLQTMNFRSELADNNNNNNNNNDNDDNNNNNNNNNDNNNNNNNNRAAERIIKELQM